MTIEGILRFQTHKTDAIVYRRERLLLSIAIDLSPAVLIGGFLGLIYFMLLLLTTFIAFSPTPIGSFDSQVRVLVKNVPWSTHFGSVCVLVAFALIGPRVLRFAFDLMMRMFSPSHMRERKRRSRRWKKLKWLPALVLLPVASAIFLMPWQASALIIALSLSKAGGAVLGFAWFGRRGRMVVCARCDYPLSTWRGSPSLCPECGSDWKAPWRARLGVRVVQWKWVATGIGMLLVSAGAVALVAMIGLKGP
jgi:hypothetical protein